MTANSPVIAIDGPSGAGKGTVAAEVAERLGWRLLDSGALYRIVGLLAVRRRIDLRDGPALAALASGRDISFTDRAVTVDGADETAAIRDPAVDAAASTVAAVPEVRAALLATQRGFRRPPGLVADGRDMGTVVFPDARAKVFLTASLEARAERRRQQLLQTQRLRDGHPRRNLNAGHGGGSVSRRAERVPLAAAADLDGLLKAIEERDARDRSRSISPLVPAADAVTIDTTTMTVGEVVETVLALAVDGA